MPLSNNHNTEIISSKDNLSGEVSFKEVIIKLKNVFAYLRSRKYTVITGVLIGALLGLGYAFYKAPVYNAELVFSLQDEKTGGGLGSALGLASQFGLDIGGGNAGGEFSGDNLLLLLNSRSMVEKTLLSPVIVKGKKETLAELYIDYNNLRKQWENKKELANIKFEPDADRTKFSLKQDSILSAFYTSLKNDNLTVAKKEKSSGIFSISVTSKSETFAKYFTEVLAKVVSDYYVQIKTEKALKNVVVLQKQTDSVRRQLNSAISNVAFSIDANPNANPSRQALRVPSQSRQVDVQTNTAILGELVKNLELSKMSLLQATPLIQIIDRPILPLQMQKISKLKGLVIGGFIGAFLIMLILILRKIYKVLIY